MYNVRRRNIFSEAEKLSCSIVAVFRPENIFYFSGYWGEGILIIKNDLSATLIVPKLESQKAEVKSKDCEVIISERGSNILDEFIKLSSNNHILSDCNDIDTINYIMNRLSYFNTSNMPFLSVREIKDSHEISQISIASSIIDYLYQIFVEEVRIGMTERQIEALLLSEAIQKGLDPISYTSNLDPLIIASGPHSSFPHSQITNRELTKGDVVVVDLTLRYNGYVSDATRTFGVAEINSKIQQVYELVKLSQIEGINSINNTAFTYDEIDNTSRKIISDSKFGQYFVHSTGHGVGLDVHELPWIRKNNSKSIRNNVVITIEPGIYIPDAFGVRVEDTIYIQNDKPINLYKFTKELQII